VTADALEGLIPAFVYTGMPDMLVILRSIVKLVVEKSKI
jgi:hypothetical protein